MFQPWPFRHNTNKNRTQNERKKDKNKAKAQTELGNLAMISMIQEIWPDLTQYNKVLHATAKVIVWCSDIMKTKKKKNPHRRKKPMWKVNIERKIEYMQGELSILTELKTGKDVKGRACRTLQRNYKIGKDSIIIIKETVKKKNATKGPKVQKIR